MKTGKLKIDLKEIAIVETSSGFLISPKDGSHLTICVNRGYLDTHKTIEKTGEKEFRCRIPLNERMTFAEELRKKVESHRPKRS